MYQGEAISLLNRVRDLLRYPDNSLINYKQVAYDIKKIENMLVEINNFLQAEADKNPSKIQPTV